MINWHLISLEILLAVILVLFTVLDLCLPKKTKHDWICVFSLIALVGLILFWSTQSPLKGITFNGMFAMDSLAWFFKGLFLLTMVFIFAMTHEFFKNSDKTPREFYLLLWLSLIGMCLIASSVDFLLLFISIEILTISLYVMTAYLKTDALSIEAGMKYLILGALASGFFLYGISFLYGVGHSTHFDVIQHYAATHPLSLVMLFAMVLIFSAVGFKISAVPFHVWVADVYQGAPTPVTALLSVGSKAAGFIILIRLFFVVFGPWHANWQITFGILSAITMTFGNCAALFQTNIKRLLGYSSIAQAGYLLMAATIGTAFGIGSINYYLLTYLFSNLAIFLVITVLSIIVKSDAIEDYAGLSKRCPLLAFTMLMGLVSLAGIPPLAGFFGKFMLLIAVLKSPYLWLALVAVANIVISMYYYLSIVKRLYADNPVNAAHIQISLHMRVLMILAVLAILILGIVQGPFLEISIPKIDISFPM
ncbi:MAG: NADH-quinone oxidoreductase subunit N [Candidatus Omnitrophica bacterium]|nr:NADH-quinone oxidoreductase subunit N [Candidatus Omnitrophota bacterium]